jgi:threonine synthase
MRANVFVPRTSPRAKLDRLRALGATVHAEGDEYAQAYSASRAFAIDHGALESHAYDQFDTLAGQGTVAREWLEQSPRLDVLLVAVGGGGLIGGIAAWLDAQARHGARVPRLVAVESEGCPTLHAALAAGRIVEVAPRGLAADSLGARRVGELMFPLAQRRVAEAVLVPDEAIVARAGRAVAGRTRRRRAGRGRGPRGARLGRVATRAGRARRRAGLRRERRPARARRRRRRRGTRIGAPMDPASHFQPSYAVSRERFLAGAHALASRHDVTIDSRAIDPKGPAGETLALDFAIFGARRPAHALVLSSGTHGVEGYVGSAIQQHVLAEVLPRLALGPDTAVILQHANNPYGFAWGRRGERVERRLQPQLPRRVRSRRCATPTTSACTTR